jgi:hypothetical protein
MPYSRSCRARNTSSILATRNWAERHWVYSGQYPRIFVAPENARNAETKCRSGVVPILLLVIPASMTGAYSSLDILQGLNPQPWLLKTLVNHSATTAVLFSNDFPGYRGLQYVQDFLVFCVILNFFKCQKSHCSHHGLPVYSHVNFTYSFPKL